MSYLSDIAAGLYKLISVREDNAYQDTSFVSSTCLSEVSYNTLTGVLTVEFVKSGARYEYFGVAESDYEDLVATFGSVGETYNEEIKGSYPYLRVG